MHALTEVLGNVYFCDFESHEREAAPRAPARPAVTHAVVADIKLRAGQINNAAKEIVAAHAEIMRQADAQSHELLALMDVIDGIVFQANVTARESPYLGAKELHELAQGAAGAVNELLALAREEVLHARTTAHRLAEIGRRSGLIEQTVA